MALSLKPLQANTTLMTQRFEGASPELASMPGRQLQQFGQAAMQMGEVGMRIATDMQLEANRVQVMAAQNAATGVMNRLSYGGDGEAGFLSMSGEAALKNPEGISLTDAYSEKLRTHLADIENNLGNDAQKAAFALWRGQAEQQFTQGVSRHQLQEFKKHEQSTYAGTIQLSTNTAAANYDDPVKVQNAIEGIETPDGQGRYGGVRHAAYFLAKSQGKSEVEAAYDVKKAVSAAHAVVITAAISNGKISYARQYMDQHKGDMLEVDALKLNGTLRTQAKTEMALTAVNMAMRDMSNQFMPNEMDRLQGIVRLMESNNQDFDKSGNPLTSPKGARFSMQVMPATAKNPGYGITPARDDSPEESNRVGREYLSAMVKEFGGNVPQALAAYNAGPGAVKKAMNEAQRDRAPENWLAFLPKETQDYVAKGVKQYESGAGKVTRPTELQFVQQAIARLPKDADAETVVATRTQAEHTFKLYDKAIKDGEEKAFEQGMRWLEQNGGNYAAMPAKLKEQIPGDKLDNLISFGDKLRKEGKVETNLAVYQKLSADDNLLKSMSDAQFYSFKTQLSEADFKHFSNERAKLLNPKAGSNSPQELNTEAINRTLGDRLRSLGKDPTPKEESADAAQLGEMRRFINQTIYEQQAVTGKKMSDMEVERHIDGLFAKSVSFQSTFLGVRTGGTTKMAMLSMKPGDIPGEIRDRLKKDFENMGIDATDAQLLGAYWKLTNRAKK